MINLLYSNNVFIANLKYLTVKMKEELFTLAVIPLGALSLHCPCSSEHDFPIIVSHLKNSNSMVGMLELKNLSSPLTAAKLALLINMPFDGHDPNT